MDKHRKASDPKFSQLTSSSSSLREWFPIAGPQGAERSYSSEEIALAMDGALGDIFYIRFDSTRQKKLVFRSIAGRLDDEAVDKILAGIVEHLAALRETDAAIGQAMESADGVAILGCD